MTRDSSVAVAKKTGKREARTSPPFGPLRGTAGFGSEESPSCTRGRLAMDLRERGSFFFTTRRRRIATEKRTRVNRQIRISPVRVIAADGAQPGIMAIEEALLAAERDGLDLVEVAPNARPPVVRIMDYGKFKYEEARKARV